MLQSPFDNDKDILERLKHPEQEADKRKNSKNLFVRNILNSLFILIAVIAMIGITVSDKEGSHLMTWYGLGLFAVVVKMVEVMLRMTGKSK